MSEFSEYVFVEPEDVREADRVSRERRRLAEVHGRHTARGQQAGGSTQQMSDELLGTRCEKAAHVFLEQRCSRKLKWWDIKKGRQLGTLPDIEDFIDVKGINSTVRRNRSIIVDEDHQEKFAYLLVDEGCPSQIGSLPYGPEQMRLLNINRARIGMEIGYITMYEIHGWCWGWEAKRPEYLESRTSQGQYRGKAYFVPIHAACLKPPSLLVEEIERRRKEVVA